MNPSDIPKLPFSPTQSAGRVLFLSGQVGLKDGKIVEGGLEAELRQAFANIREVLEKSGMRLTHIADVTAFLAEDMADYATFNRVYVEEFEADGVFTTLPTRTTVAAAALPLGARVELKVIAALR